MRKKKNYLLAGVMTAVLTAANSITVMAAAEVPAFEIPASSAESGQAAGIAGAVQAVEAGSNPSAEDSSSESGAAEGSSSVAGAGSGAAAESSSPVVAAGSGAAAESSSPVVGAGSGTPAGGSSPVIGAGMAANASGGIGPGIAGSQKVPGGQELTGLENVVPGRIDYFSEPVNNPTVAVAEKYSYESMVSDLEKLKSRYGSRLQVNVIGTSLDGRNLYEAVLGNPNAGKHILIHAGIHAREYMTPLLVMKQLEYGLEFYDRGSFDGQPLSTILQQVAVHFVPMVNPDGIALSQFGLEAIRSEELRQGILQCYASDTALGRTSAALDRYLIYWKANGRGVDLNQNFPANWERLSSELGPSYANCRGTEPLSEPETQALANLVNSRKWSATVSYHSMGNIIYWDYEGNRVRQASGELTALIEASTGYRASGSSGHGGFKDWTQIKEDPIPGVTIETGSVACPLPISEFIDIWNRNKMVWALVARYAMEH